MKTPCLTPSTWAALRSFLQDHLGLYFPDNRLQDLAKGLQAAGKDLGFPDLAALADHLLSAPVDRQLLLVLASRLTIGETYFFRDQGAFAFLAQYILPALTAARRDRDRRLRLWSAGCASGEEAYSLAITLHQNVVRCHEWHITLLATDVNPQALAKARRGVYSSWSFRGVPDRVRDTYFTPLDGNRWEIKPWIKSMVSFAELNLATDPFPAPSTNTHDLDIIFCRNVLMYLAPEVAGRIIRNFAAALREGGWLLVSPAECCLVQESCFHSHPQPHTVPFQKITRLIDRPPSLTGSATGCQQAGPSAPGWQATGLTGTSDGTSLPLSSSKGNPLMDGTAPEETSCRGFAAARGGALSTTATAAPGPPQAPESPPEPAGSRPAETAGGAASPLHSEDAAVLAARAKACADLGQLEEAGQWGARAIATDCLNPQYYYLLATILAEQQQLAEATRLLKQALYLQNDFVLAHFLLGRLAMAEQCPEKACRHFNNVLQLLAGYADEEQLPAAEGLTAGALRQAVLTIKTRLSAGSPETALTKVHYV